MTLSWGVLFVLEPWHSWSGTSQPWGSGAGRNFPKGTPLTQGLFNGYIILRQAYAALQVPCLVTAWLPLSPGLAACRSKAILLGAQFHLLEYINGSGFQAT
jgi:hypothetical protein